MGNGWEMKNVFTHFFIKVDLCLILFLRLKNR